jgi:hypothetical protein
MLQRGFTMALEDIQRMQMVQDVAQSPETMDDMQVMRRGGQGLQAAPMNTQAPIPQFVPDEVMSMDVKQNLNEMLTATLPDGDSIAAKALEKIVKNNKLLSDMIDQTRDIASAATGGGLMQLAAGGEFSGMVPGDGHGMEDNVYMPIKEGEEQVATLAVSPTEYVVDSYTMAALGNGNPVEGAERMDEVVKSIRKEAYGTDKQPNQIDGLAALEPMMERV